MATNDPSTIYGSQEAAGDPEGLGHWKSLAQKYWSKPTKAKKVNPEVIKKEIWDVLQADSFEYRSLLALDNLQLLEKFVCHEGF